MNFKELAKKNIRLYYYGTTNLELKRYILGQRDMYIELKVEENLNDKYFIDKVFDEAEELYNEYIK